MKRIHFFSTRLVPRFLQNKRFLFRHNQIYVKFFIHPQIKRYKTYVSVLKPKLDGDTGGDPNRHFLALQKANNDLLNSAAVISGTTTNNITLTTGNSSGALTRSPATSPTTPMAINSIPLAEEPTTIVQPQGGGVATITNTLNQRENKNSNLQSSNRYSYRAAIYRTDGQQDLG